MKLLKKYDDYLLDLVVESFNAGAPLFFSTRFKKLLQLINHPIAFFLLGQENKPDYKSTYIDLDDSGLDKVSFISSTKAAEILTGKKRPESEEVTDDLFYNSKFNSEIFNKLLTTNRTSTTIGRLINKLFPKEFDAGGKPGEDIQSFTDKFKSLRDSKELELVEDSDIVKFYLEENYLAGGGTLGSSCMRDEDCSEYIEFYEKNSHVVSMLVLKTEDDEGEEKIKARALVWQLSQPEDRIFMDRVYTIFPHDTEKFISHAKQNGWLYKETQNSSSHAYIIDPLDGSSHYRKLVVREVETNDTYPYLDTLKYFNTEDGVLSNDEDYFGKSMYYTLEDTDGSYIEREGEWSDFYGEYINTDDDEMVYCEFGDDWRYVDDAIYIEFYGQWATESYAENNMESCDYYDYDQGEYRKERDTVSVYGTGEIACSDYAGNNLTHSDYHGEYLPEGKEVWSDYHESYLYRDEAVEVYLNPEQTKEDWRSEDESDGNWWEWDYDGDKYDDDVTEEELNEWNDIDDDEED